MRYMRCKCGKRECWTSMGHPRCDGCPDCKTTLAEHPDDHREIAPHEFVEEWDINRETGERWKLRRCRRCQHEEKVEEPTA